MMMLFGSIEPELVPYIALNPSLTNAEVAALDVNLKSIKYGSGIVLNAVTANLSIVDGTAFISNPSVDLRPYLGFKLSFSDGSKTLVGYAKAAGTGETLGEELYGTYDFTNAAWATAGIVTKEDADTFTTTGVGGVRSPGIYSSGALIKALSVTGSTTATSCSVYDFFSSGASDLIGAIPVSNAYRTAVGGGFYFRNANAGVTDITAISAKQVLTPSATGLTVVSTAGGTTYNWASNGGIKANAASFTVTITKE